MFIQCTVKDSNKTIHINVDRIDYVDPGMSGCVIRTSGLSLHVEESHRQVLEMIKDVTNQKEKKNGKKNF